MEECSELALIEMACSYKLHWGAGVAPYLQEAIKRQTPKWKTVPASCNLRHLEETSSGKGQSRRQQFYTEPRSNLKHRGGKKWAATWLDYTTCNNDVISTTQSKNNNYQNQ